MKILPTLFSTLTVVAALTGQARAQAAPLPRNDNILIDYQDPVDPVAVFAVDANDTSKRAKELLAKYARLQGIAERLRQRKVLERYAQFLVPLRLPTILRLIAHQCGEPNAYFRPADVSINLCYEYIEKFEDEAPTTTTKDGVSRVDAVIGGIVGTLLHETGHALFHLYRIPVLGREEDAADQIAAYTMLQFGDKVAETTVKGALWKWRDWRGVNLSDTHSTAQQRFGIFLCLAYGAKPKVFQSLIDGEFLLPARAANCKAEYQQIEYAFAKTIVPHIEPGLMEKVRSATWFFPEDDGIIPVKTR